MLNEIEPGAGMQGPDNYNVFTLHDEQGKYRHERTSCPKSFSGARGLRWVEPSLSCSHSHAFAPSWNNLPSVLMLGAMMNFRFPGTGGW